MINGILAKNVALHLLPFDSQCNREHKPQIQEHKLHIGGIRDDWNYKQCTHLTMDDI